jgi:hypothetical protein
VLPQDDNETRITGARRANVTGAGAWVPGALMPRILALSKSLKSGNFILARLSSG